MLSFPYLWAPSKKQLENVPVTKHWNKETLVCMWSELPFTEVLLTSINVLVLDEQLETNFQLLTLHDSWTGGTLTHPSCHPENKTLWLPSSQLWLYSRNWLLQVAFKGTNIRNSSIYMVYIYIYLLILLMRLKRPQKLFSVENLCFFSLHSWLAFAESLVKRRSSSPRAAEACLMLPLTPTGGLEPPRRGSAGGKRSDWFALGVTESSPEFSIGIAKLCPNRRGGKHVKKKHIRIS